MILLDLGGNKRTKDIANTIFTTKMSLPVLTFNAMAKNFCLSYFFDHNMTSNLKMIKIKGNLNITQN